MKITVFSKKPCVQCNATFRALDKKNADYDVVSVTEDAEALEFIQKLGFQQAPVVMISEDTLTYDKEVILDSWTGFVPDKIDEYAALTEAVAA